MEHDVFQLSHGIKNIHRSKFYQQHTQWMKSLLQLLLLKVCGLCILKSVKYTLDYLSFPCISKVDMT